MKSPIPKLYINLSDQLNDLIKKGYKFYADVDKDTGLVTKIYGELLDKTELKKHLTKK